MKKILVLFFLLFASDVFGATYYVSTTGNDSTGDGSIGNPWLTPVYGASQLTSDGDVLRIRAGTYDVTTSTSNRTCAIYPRANNCTIQAMPGESVTLRGGRGGANFGVFPTGGTIGVVSGYSGLTIDGITIQGMVMFDGNSAGTQPSTIKNCDISVGGDGWSGTAQGAVIWIDDAVNVRIYNNKLHDNDVGAESIVPANNGLIMMYECSADCIVENNDMYNSAGTGLTMKDDVENAVVRYNFIHDNAAGGVWTGNNTASDYTKSADIYQNIIANNNTSNLDEQGGVVAVVETSLINIYNNTFHQNYNGDLVQWPVDGDTVPLTFYNNISYSPRENHLTWPYGSSVFDVSYLNYNAYYNDVTWNYHGTSYTTISAWQTQCQSLLTGCDANSITTDPGFLNASGDWALATDYKRSSYATNGRGGACPSVMGAYITGNETIGYSSAIAPILPGGSVVGGVIVH